MNIAIISGSNRNDSESLRVAKYMKKRIEERSQMTTTLIDLHETPISVSPDDNYNGKKDPNFKKIADQIKACDGLVLVSPEWSGSASPMLRALLIFIGSEASYKPALLAGVSAARGGAYPIHELKAGGNKNNFIVFLPEHLIFRDVANLLKTEQPQSKEDMYIRERTDYAIGLLEQFTIALRLVRESGALDLKKYSYGM